MPGIVLFKKMPTGYAFPLQAIALKKMRADRPLKKTLELVPQRKLPRAVAGILRGFCARSRPESL